MHRVLVNNKLRLIPSSWEELSMNPRDLTYVVSLFFDGLTEMELLNNVSLRFLKLGRAMKYRLAKLFKYHPDHEHTYEIGAEIYQIVDSQKYITNTTLTVKNNVFPSLFFWRRLYNTGNVLKDFTGWEYALAEQAMITYMETKDEQYLNELIAIWYRPRRWLWFMDFFTMDCTDLRTKFNDKQISKRVKRIGKLPLEIRYIILLYFQYQRDIITKLFSTVFKSSKSDGQKGTWLDIFFSMSTTGQEDLVANTNLAIILKRMEYNAKVVGTMKKTD
jgi:hypothetical protein